jgi:hypothetical protein
MRSTGELVRLAGVVRAGERVEVELLVGGACVAKAASGDRVTVAGDAEVTLDVSSLSLAPREPERYRGTWGELERRAEAALVRDRSPAPHVQAELVVRRIAPGASIAVDAVVVDRAFDEPRTHREPAAQRVRAMRAVAFSSSSAAPPARARSVPWSAIPWALSALAITASLLATPMVTELRAVLVTAAVVISILVAARFAQRALSSAPPMDQGLAHPFTRFFARGARSLPRFTPRARDATRGATAVLSIPAVLGWGFIVLIAGAWPSGLLSGSIRSIAPESAAMMGAEAGVMALLAFAYLAADRSEVSRVRALLAALEATSGWRARLGIVRTSDPIFRRVVVEADAYAESPSFSASNREGGAERFEVVTDAGPVSVERAELEWASDDWTSTPRSAEMSVRDGARAIVAGFAEGGTLAPRGPGSMMLFASRDRPDEVLRAALRRRALDAGLAAIAAALCAALAAAIYLA